MCLLAGLSAGLEKLQIKTTELTFMKLALHPECTSLHFDVDPVNRVDSSKILTFSVIY